ncbi:MAG: hypothetical protein M3Z09_06055 [Acidobacteriota bacterium]|nr:hypothetical protein [Acidobacteriota bacterium]
MNTRGKILQSAEAAERAQAFRASATPYTLVCSTFDVLTAPRLRRLREIAATGNRLIAVVTNPPNPLLPRRARAELAAALAIIEFVVLAEEPHAPFLASLGPASVIDEAPEDELRTADLIEHVQRKNSAARD